MSRKAGGDREKANLTTNGRKSEIFPGPKCPPGEKNEMSSGRKADGGSCLWMGKGSMRFGKCRDGEENLWVPI